MQSRSDAASRRAGQDDDPRRIEAALLAPEGPPAEVHDGRRSVVDATSTRAARWESCRSPTVTHRWEGRRSDQEWLPGLYPASHRVGRGRLALTFDDGPMRGTGALLDLLQAVEVKAAFFLTGWSIKASTYHHVQRALREGHTLGNHGWRHDTDMAQRFRDRDRLEAYIAAELELTQIRVDLALLANGPDDFRVMEREVFAGLSIRDSPEDELTQLDDLRARHEHLLTSRGYSLAVRPHQLRFVRPPGGNPYLGARFSPAQRDAFARAAGRQRLVLVMWSSGSGDSTRSAPAAVRRDPKRLVAAIERAAARGGIFVAHDRISPQGAAAVLTRLATMRSEGHLELVDLDTLIYESFEAQGLCPPPVTRTQ